MISSRGFYCIYTNSPALIDYQGGDRPHNYRVLISLMLLTTQHGSILHLKRLLLYSLDVEIFWLPMLLCPKADLSTHSSIQYVHFYGLPL